MRRLAIAVLVLLAACGGKNDKTSSPPSTTLPFSTNPISTPSSSEQGQLTDVRVAAHAGFVRVVFTFANAVPSFAVKSATPPFVQDASGKTVSVAGKAFVAVRLMARAHDDAGKATAPTAITRSSTDVRLLGDFEGVVNYVIGLDHASGFRTSTLAYPSRLIVDTAV